MKLLLLLVAVAFAQDCTEFQEISPDGTTCQCQFGRENFPACDIECLKKEDAMAAMMTARACFEDNGLKANTGLPALCACAAAALAGLQDTCSGPNRFAAQDQFYQEIYQKFAGLGTTCTEPSDADGCKAFDLVMDIFGEDFKECRTDADSFMQECECAAQMGGFGALYDSCPKAGEFLKNLKNSVRDGWMCPDPDAVTMTICGLYESPCVYEDKKGIYKKIEIAIDSEGYGFHREWRGDSCATMEYGMTRFHAQFFGPLAGTPAQKMAVFLVDRFSPKDSPPYALGGEVMYMPVEMDTTGSVPVMKFGEGYQYRKMGWGMGYDPMNAQVFNEMKTCADLKLKPEFVEDVKQVETDAFHFRNFQKEPYMWGQQKMQLKEKFGDMASAKMPMLEQPFAPVA